MLVPATLRVAPVIAVIAVIIVTVAACSGDDADAPPATEPVAAPTSAAAGGSIEDASESVSESVSDVSESVVEDGAEITQPDVERTVTAALTAPADLLVGDVSVDFDTAAVSDLDPFGRFASCSAFGASVAAYSVSVADPAVGAIGLQSVGRIDGAGTYDADIRVEPALADPVRAVGTVTLADDLASGSFSGVSLEGSEVAGSFTCEGEPRPSEPIEPDATGASGVDTVEIAVIVQRDAAERVVHFAASATGDPAIVCPVTGAVDEMVDDEADDEVDDEVDDEADDEVDDDLVLDVVVEPPTGGIDRFELLAGSDPSLRVRMGGVEYVVDDPVIDGEVTAGSFSGATADDVQIAGAFRCN